MAHNNFYILEKLLHLLDDPRNDIYVHIDKKVSEFDFVHYDLRLIDWSRSPNGNNPHTFTSDDWDMLIGSEKLFARKFSVDIDKDIVDRLYAHTINRQLIADK